MIFYITNETDVTFDFDIEQTVKDVCTAVLDEEKCPYETEISVTLVDDSVIRQINQETRNIDKATDVLSFPNVDYVTPGDFDISEDSEADYFNPDTGELILGDIVISVDHVAEQAEAYGHSRKREFAFLVAHSMFHLCGYDHMTEDEARIMEQKQSDILNALGITRDQF